MLIFEAIFQISQNSPIDTPSNYIKFIISRGGKKKLLFNGFFHNTSMRRKDRTSWKCNGKSCPGKVTLVIVDYSYFSSTPYWSSTFCSLHPTAIKAEGRNSGSNTLLGCSSPYVFRFMKIPQQGAYKLLQRFSIKLKGNFIL